MESESGAAAIPRAVRLTDPPEKYGDMTALLGRFEFVLGWRGEMIKGDAADYEAARKAEGVEVLNAESAERLLAGEEEGMGPDSGDRTRYTADAHGNPVWPQKIILSYPVGDYPPEVIGHATHVIDMDGQMIKHPSGQQSMATPSQRLDCTLLTPGRAERLVKGDSPIPEDLRGRIEGGVEAAIAAGAKPRAVIRAITEAVREGLPEHGFDLGDGEEASDHTEFMLGADFGTPDVAEVIEDTARERRRLHPGAKPALLDPEATFTFSGEELATLLYGVGGAATRPLLEDLPGYVFPAERVAEAIEELVAEADFAATTRGLPTRKQLRCAWLTGPAEDYPHDLISHATLLIAPDGVIIKSRIGREGRRPTPGEAASCVLVTPETAHRVFAVNAQPEFRVRYTWMVRAVGPEGEHQFKAIDAGPEDSERLHDLETATANHYEKVFGAPPRQVSAACLPYLPGEDGADEKDDPAEGFDIEREA